jgi:hypothetical protein
MPYSSLFDFSRVKNNLVKIALGGVKNFSVPQPKLHPSFSKPLPAESHNALVYSMPHS